MDIIQTVDSFIREIPEDNDTLIENLEKQHMPEKTFKTEFPSAVDIPTLLAIIRRCKEVSEYFRQPVRVIGWSYNRDVERFVNSCNSQASSVTFTFLPGYLKERFHE